MSHVRSGGSDIQSKSDTKMGQTERRLAQFKGSEVSNLWKKKNTKGKTEPFYIGNFKLNMKFTAALHNVTAIKQLPTTLFDAG